VTAETGEIAAARLCSQATGWRDDGASCAAASDIPGRVRTASLLTYAPRERLSAGMSFEFREDRGGLGTVGRVGRKTTFDRAKARRWGTAGMVAMLLFGLQVAGAAPSSAATGKTVGSGTFRSMADRGARTPLSGPSRLGRQSHFTASSQANGSAVRTGPRTCGMRSTAAGSPRMPSSTPAPIQRWYRPVHRPSSAPASIRSRGPGAAACS
jgi:hypothetical protein